MARPKFQIFGFDEYAELLAAIGEKGEEIARRAVHKGAGVLADEVRKKINALPTTEFAGYSPNTMSPALTKSQKEALLKGLGITPIDNQGGIVNARVGFDGYMADYVSFIPTKKYPKGLPVPMIANITESGSEYRRATPFFRSAVNSSKNKVKKAMSEEFDKELKKLRGKG